jgi:hypothetical protein
MRPHLSLPSLALLVVIAGCTGSAAVVPDPAADAPDAPAASPWDVPEPYASAECIDEPDPRMPAVTDAAVDPADARQIAALPQRVEIALSRLQDNPWPSWAEWRDRRPAADPSPTVAAAFVELLQRRRQAGDGRRVVDRAAVVAAIHDQVPIERCDEACREFLRRAVDELRSHDRRRLERFALVQNAPAWIVSRVFGLPADGGSTSGAATVVYRPQILRDAGWTGAGIQSALRAAVAATHARDTHGEPTARFVPAVPIIAGYGTDPCIALRRAIVQRAIEDLRGPADGDPDTTAFLPDPAALLAELIASETHPAVWEALANDLPAHPQVLAAALTHANATCRTTALRLCATLDAAAIGAEVLAGIRAAAIAAHPRVRAAARQTLAAWRLPLPPDDAGPGLPDELRARLAAIVEAGWADPARSVRVSLPDDRAAWRIPGTDLSLSDEGHLVRSGAGLRPRDRSTADDFADLTADLNGTAPDTDVVREQIWWMQWIVGSPNHNLLRFAFACRHVESRLGGAELRAQLDRWYPPMLDQFDDADQAVRRLAAVMAWRHLAGALTAFTEQDWEIAQAHVDWAEGLARVEPAHPAVVDRLRDIRRIGREITARRDEPDEAELVVPTGDPAAAARFWVSQMHRLTARQFSQPGSPQLVTGEGRVCRALLDLGPHALRPLLDRMHKAAARPATGRRLIRGYGYWRIFHPTRDLLTVGQAAGRLIEMILAAHYGLRLRDEFYWSVNRPDMLAVFDELGVP